MKASMKLKIKSKKLKELSTERAKLVAGGGGGNMGNPPQAQGNATYWSIFYTCNC
ncbi:hypothetical protein PSECIP111854_00314 [Pseudoalteromonas sp. CIP111854]|uniref:Uncharacterized protein n=1 Tax=Pseudoalteromonas holothuriae TaxID=2963714 RepID=A0A9W4QR98_9GAMM|nr:hypothetical protein [Pseudoalteromonas sp. CIP111854]CAH9049667.1 hypothetical protein PSECIP111854_00314 [Pseudoalteromonas sp. CIP111854]